MCFHHDRVLTCGLPLVLPLIGPIPLGIHHVRLASIFICVLWVFDTSIAKGQGLLDILSAAIEIAYLFHCHILGSLTRAKDWKQLFKDNAKDILFVIAPMSTYKRVKDSKRHLLELWDVKRMTWKGHEYSTRNIFVPVRWVYDPGIILEPPLLESFNSGIPSVDSQSVVNDLHVLFIIHVNCSSDMELSTALSQRFGELDGTIFNALVISISHAMLHPSDIQVLPGFIFFSPLAKVSYTFLNIIAGIFSRIGELMGEGEMIAFVHVIASLVCSLLVSLVIAFCSISFSGNYIAWLTMDLICATSTTDLSIGYFCDSSLILTVATALIPFKGIELINFCSTNIHAFDLEYKVNFKEGNVMIQRLIGNGPKSMAKGLGKIDYMRKGFDEKSVKNFVECSLSRFDLL